MNTLAISVTRQAGGFNFSLKPLVRQQLRSMFPTADFLPSIFVSHTAQQDFERLQGRLIEHIVPALTGLTTSELAQINQIMFVDTANGGHLGDYNPRDAAA